MDRDVFERAGARLADWPRTMILAHDRPDGDAIGAMAAMKRIIEAAGRQATAFVYDEVPKRYAFFDAAYGFDRWPTESVEAIDQRFDGVLILDTCTWQQLETATSYLQASTLPKIIVDHHATYEELKGAGDADLYVIDGSASATCGLVYAWCKTMEWVIDAAAAEALFTGLATDTGWFRFSNTDGRTLRAAAALVEIGIRPDVMYDRLEACYSVARVRLKAAMLETLEFVSEGTVAMMSLTKATFERAGAVAGDAEELVNEPMSAGAVVASVLLTDMDNGVIRVNFRSKSPEACGRDLDVASVAQRFGGGGHRRAAGARVAGSLEEVYGRVKEAMVSAIS